MKYNKKVKCTNIGEIDETLKVCYDNLKDFIKMAGKNLTIFQFLLM